MNKQLSKIFFKEDKGKKYFYSTGDVVFSSIMGGMSGFSSFRDIVSAKNIIPISPSQFCQRTMKISSENIRDYLFENFIHLKRNMDFRESMLIIDKTFLPLSKGEKWGKFCKTGEIDSKPVYEWGCEYSFACIYFPMADKLIILDWEFIPKGSGEATASKIMMSRLHRIFKQKKVRIRLIVADRLYFDHFYFKKWTTEISEGFLTLTKRNSLVRKNGKGFLDQVDFRSKPEFYKGITKYKGKRFKIWEIHSLYWADNNDHRKYVTENETKNRNLRLVIAYNEEEDFYWYTITNASFLINAFEILHSYEKRWQIETFFQIAKCNKTFGTFIKAKKQSTFTIRMILKLIGICLFFLYMRFRRDSLNHNKGFNIGYFIKKYFDEFKYGLKIYTNSIRRFKWIE